MMIVRPRPVLSLRHRLPPSALHVARARAHRAAPVSATVIFPLCFKRWFVQQPHMLLYGELRRKLSGPLHYND